MYNRYFIMLNTFWKCINRVYYAKTHYIILNFPIFQRKKRKMHKPRNDPILIVIQFHDNSHLLLMVCFWFVPSNFNLLHVAKKINKRITRC